MSEDAPPYGLRTVARGGSGWDAPRPSTGRPTTLRQAALTAGAALLVMVVAAPVAEFLVYANVRTPQDLLAHRGLFLGGLFLYLITFAGDVVAAWALYLLLAPVSRTLSLLTAWFRLVHAIIALTGLAKLATAFRLLSEPTVVAAADAGRLEAHVQILLGSFRYEWSFSMVFFAIHLAMLGHLVHRSGYIPRVLGILLLIAGVGHLAYFLGPYLYPGAGIRLLMITFLGDAIFMLWLLARGRRIEEPVPA